MSEASIIILTYNSSSYIEDLIKSLRDFASNAEILIVDNDSKDDTLKLTKKFEKEVKIIETGKNLGFAKGINYGAKKSSGKYLLFINPDTLFRHGKLTDMISLLEQNEKMGVVGGKMIGKDNKVEKSAGKFFNLLEVILIVMGLDEKFGVRFSPNRLEKVDFVSGGFMMVRADIFKKLNGFDENFFMYVEDMEFCYRVKKSGFKTYFTPDVSISHAGQGSSNRTFAIVNIYKGILYFYKKNKGSFEYNVVKFLLSAKARSIYLLGRLTNNTYYMNTYKEALLAIK